MTRSKALLLAAFTLWPIVYIVLFISVVFSQVLFAAGSPSLAGGMPLIFKFILPLHLFTMLEIFVLIAIYIMHIFKTDVVVQDKKALWAVVIFCGNMIAMPVYWYLYIWKTIQEPKSEV